MFVDKFSWQKNKFDFVCTCEINQINETWALCFTLAAAAGPGAALRDTFDDLVPNVSRFSTIGVRAATIRRFVQKRYLILSFTL